VFSLDFGSGANMAAVLNDHKPLSGISVGFEVAWRASLLSHLFDRQPHAGSPARRAREAALRDWISQPRAGDCTTKLALLIDPGTVESSRKPAILVYRSGNDEDVPVRSQDVDWMTPLT
jgi:hypothetical protein